MKITLPFHSLKSKGCSINLWYLFVVYVFVLYFILFHYSIGSEISFISLLLDLGLFKLIHWLKSILYCNFKTYFLVPVIGIIIVFIEWNIYIIKFRFLRFQYLHLLAFHILSQLKFSVIFLRKFKSELHMQFFGFHA